MKVSWSKWSRLVKQAVKMKKHLLEIRRLILLDFDDIYNRIIVITVIYIARAYGIIRIALVPITKNVKYKMIPGLNHIRNLEWCKRKNHTSRTT